MIMAAKLRMEGGKYYGFDLAETAKTFMRMPTTAAKKRAWNHFYYFYQKRYENDEHNAKR